MARKKAESLPPLSDTLLPAQAGDVRELDELWRFAGSKANACWAWIALCRQTRQIVAYFAGDRSAESARALRERIPPTYRRRATRSDFWLACDEVFPRRTHRSTGKGAGETCCVERRNCTLRQRPGRFVRKTLSFSKCNRMHELALRLFIHHHNLSFNKSPLPFLGIREHQVIFPEMSTLAEIEAAVAKLPPTQQEALFAFLASRLGLAENGRRKARHGLKAAAYPALEGLPADLSTGTKDRVRALVAKRHGANR